MVEAAPVLFLDVLQHLHPLKPREQVSQKVLGSYVSGYFFVCRLAITCYFLVFQVNCHFEDDLVGDVMSHLFYVLMEVKNPIKFVMENSDHRKRLEPPGQLASFSEKIRIVDLNICAWLPYRHHLNIRFTLLLFHLFFLLWKLRLVQFGWS
jgi:hypothetical protein